ncbi:MAG: hypothetical protein ACTSPV_12200 [Candidatus Hodarchaeales archaeon]
MNPKTLILCQGLQISKIVASILSHSPQNCIIIRSYYDISDKIRNEIDQAIVKVLTYIEDNIAFFPNLKEVYEIQADIFNPVSILKSLEIVLEEKYFTGLDYVIDLSTGTIPANIGLYLFALKHQITELTFCFPGERYVSTSQTDPTIKFQKEVEFAREFQFFVPLLPAKIGSIDDELLTTLEKERDTKISSLYELSEKLQQPTNAKQLMALSRECDRLSTLGLISSRRIGKNKEIKITSSGLQYMKFKKFPEPKVKLIWKRNPTY